MQLTLRKFLKASALLFLAMEALALIASLVEFAAKMTYWSRASFRTSWLGAAIEPTLRFVIMGLTLSCYLHLRNASRLPLNATRQSALLTTRAVQSALLAAIALYALVAEKIGGFPDQTSLLPAWSLCAVAFLTVVAALVLRKRLLFVANQGLRRDPDNAEALSRWQKVTIVSMVLAMSIALYGFCLRIMGNSRSIEWAFFLVSVALLFLWKPHLDDAAASPETRFSTTEDFDS